MNQKEYQELYNELICYIKNVLFTSIFILHPQVSIDTKDPGGQLKCLSEGKRQIIGSIDRNLFGQLISAVKKGSFSGSNRKQLTAFLIWTTMYRIQLTPFDALKEQAFIQNDN